ncbi:MAG: tetratricopeptide repeat protein [Chlamydiales bacterium]|nr:tetratricopeptide repeat protein [Chlamydiales bacterium]
MRSQFPESTELLLHHYAYSCYQRGLYDKAISGFGQLVMHYPNKGAYWYGLGSSHMLQGNDEDAAHAFQIACINSPEDPRAHAYWAECAARLGRQDIASLAIKQAEKLAVGEKFASFLGQVEVIKERIVEVSHGR